jgi:protein-histidine pros-kinase
MTKKNGERQRAARRFVTLLESAPDAILIVDREGEIVLASAEAARLFGYERQELTGLTVEALIPHSLRAAHSEYRETFHVAPRARGMGSGGNLEGLRKDGTQIPVEISLSPVVTEAGLWVIAAVRDLSERVQRQELARENERLAEASRIKSRFLANMSHELRTPLNAVIGFTELLYDEQAGAVTAQQKDFLADILSSANHLLHLINDMLDLARVEAGKMDFQPSTFAVSKLLAEVRDSVRILAAQKKLELALEVAPGLDLVRVDPLKLKQVLLNYLANAIKFTPEGGKVTLRARREGTTFRVEVEDTGPGIPAHQLPLLFVEFQQLDAGTRLEQRGTGLGLALSKRLVEAQGGRVGVESTVGKGSVFFAILPCDAAQP